MSKLLSQNCYLQYYYTGGMSFVQQRVAYTSCVLHAKVEEHLGLPKLQPLHTAPSWNIVLHPY